jgi:hypothetical protein
MDNIFDIIINLLHEVNLVLSDESSENKLEWCYSQCKKNLSDENILIIKTTYNLTDDIDVLKYYIGILWFDLFKERVFIKLNIDESINLTNSIYGIDDNITKSNIITDEVLKNDNNVDNINKKMKEYSIQTDPNCGNFIYDADNNVLKLIEEVEEDGEVKEKIEEVESIIEGSIVENTEQEAPKKRGRKVKK